MTTKKALAYLRTSSAANVGEDKDSDKRQMAAIESYAGRAGFEIVLPPYYDAAVKGADPVESRPGFKALLDHLALHPEVRTILVETANRFARDLIVQEIGHRMLKDRGIELIAVDSPDSFIADGPTPTLIRQVLGAVAQFEKAMVVSKLRVARDRKRAANGKCEGRKSHAEANGAVVELARKLRSEASTTSRIRSYRNISEILVERGHFNRDGRPYSAAAVMSMVNGPQQRASRIAR
jgi:DNA invertase Pin-like site-specific DNA recombinase